MGKDLMKFYCFDLRTARLPARQGTSLPAGKGRKG